MSLLLTSPKNGGITGGLPSVSVSGVTDEDLWDLVTIVVMGRTPLEVLLLYGIAVNFSGNSKELLDQVTPVNIVGRSAIRDFTVGSLALHAGQTIYLSPYLSALDGKFHNPTLTFGAGIHTCPGRKMAYLIADDFFRALKHNDSLEIVRDDILFHRDLITTCRKIEREDCLPH